MLFFLVRFSLRKQSDDASFRSTWSRWALCGAGRSASASARCFFQLSPSAPPAGRKSLQHGTTVKQHAHAEATRSLTAKLLATNRRRCINCIINCIYVYIHGSWFSECNHTGLFVYGLTGWRLSRPLEYWKSFFIALENAAFFCLFVCLSLFLFSFEIRGLDFFFLVQDMICKVLICAIILWANIFRCRVCYSRTKV